MGKVMNLSGQGQQIVDVKNSVGKFRNLVGKVKNVVGKVKKLVGKVIFRNLQEP